MPGQGVLGFFDLADRSFRHHLAAVNASAGADIDDMVGAADGFFIMFHHQHGIAQVAQVKQGIEQAAVITLVQANRGFVEDIHHPHQAGADLAGQADALGLTTGESVGTAAQGQVVQAHIHQKT